MHSTSWKRRDAQQLLIPCCCRGDEHAFQAQALPLDRLPRIPICVLQLVVSVDQHLGGPGRRAEDLLDEHECAAVDRVLVHVADDAAAMLDGDELERENREGQARPDSREALPEIDVLDLDDAAPNSSEKRLRAVSSMGCDTSTPT